MRSSTGCIRVRDNFARDFAAGLTVGVVARLGEDNLRASLEDALYIVGAPRETLVGQEAI